jgi:hypothetical protein
VCTAYRLDEEKAEYKAPEEALKEMMPIDVYEEGKVALLLLVQQVVKQGHFTSCFATCCTSFTCFERSNASER